jgi:ketosteroid isomerase-like protein
VGDDQAVPDDDLFEAMAKFDRAIQEQDRELASETAREDFALVLVQPTPATMPRTRWIEMLPDYLVHDWQVEERSTNVDGDCAAVHQRVAMKATVMGEDRSGIFVITDIWRRDLDGWHLWRRFSTPMTAGAMPT